MPLGARQHGVAAPDEPHPRPVLRGIGIVDRKTQLLVLELLDDALNDLAVGLRAGALGLGHDVERIAVEVRGHTASSPQRTAFAWRSIAWPLAQRGFGLVRPYSVNSRS